MLYYGALSTGSAHPRRLVVSAAAKVNLTLEVLGRRDDGYHELSSVMQAIDLCDRLVLEDADTMELRCTSADVPGDRRNLALRAAWALREAAGIGRGVRITLGKRIPVAAGLGGGSTDAAAVLLGLNRLWGLRWRRGRLDEVAMTLGMDVPFFLRGGAAHATGRGERLRPVTSTPLALVLVNPRIPLSTAEIYGRVRPPMYSDGGHARAMIRALETRRPARVAEHLVNGLEAALGPMRTDVTRIKSAAMAAGALGALMSGSGPTVFAVARSFEHARQLRRRLTTVSWSCWAVRTLGGAAVRFQRRAP